MSKATELQMILAQIESLRRRVDELGARDSAGGYLTVTDGVTAPSATAGLAKIFVDTADGDLKIIYGDGTTKLIVADS